MKILSDNNLSKKSKETALLFLSLTLFVLDRLWGFIFTQTIFSLPIVVYVAFVTLFFLFLRLGILYGMGGWSLLSRVWAPYLLYTLLGYLFHFDFQDFSYWFCCFILILIATRCFIIQALPIKIVIVSGIIAMVGVFVQLLFPSFYNSNISPLFIDKEIISFWTDERGLNGFTYQLGLTALLLVYCEVFLICLRDKLKSMLVSNSVLYFFLLALLIVSVYLTGKRTLTIIALMLPFILIYKTRKKVVSRIFVLAFLVIVVIIGSNYFLRNVGDLENARFASKYVSTYTGVQSGEDISSGRSLLYELALKSYRENPIFGIGIGNYKSYNRIDTDVHNTYLQVLCEQGIVGFVLYIIPIIVSLLYTNKLYRHVSTKLKNYILLSFALQFMFIIDAFTSNCNLGSSFVFYFIAIAIVINVDTIEKSSL